MHADSGIGPYYFNHWTAKAVNNNQVLDTFILPKAEQFHRVLISSSVELFQALNLLSLFF